MIKLIAIDLDGTLVNSQKQLSRENYEALHYAHQQGVKIVLCTGRPYLAMKHLVEEIGLNTEDDYIITFNGSQIQGASDGRVLASYTISRDEMLTWYEETNRLALPLNVIDQDWVYEPTSYPEGRPSWYVDRVTSAPSKLKDFNEFPADHQFNKLVISQEPDYIQSGVQAFNPNLASQYNIVRSHPHLYEIGQQGVSKGNALKELGKQLGIDMADMMAIGDEDNDMSMIEMAGIGVAMGNAIDPVKEIAQYVTATNDESGVAQAIYHYLGEESEG